MTSTTLAATAAAGACRVGLRRRRSSRGSCGPRRRRCAASDGEVAGRGTTSLAGGRPGFAVAPSRPFTGDQDARVDPYPEARLQRARSEIVGRSVDGGLDLKGRPNSSLWIVFVDGRNAEDCQHRVTGELLDRALVPTNLLADTLENAADDTGDDLRLDGVL